MSAEEENLAELPEHGKDAIHPVCRKCHKPLEESERCLCRRWLCYRCCECDMDCDLCNCNQRRR